jgi:hypothetical protein
MVGLVWVAWEVSGSCVVCYGGRGVRWQLKNWILCEDQHYLVLDT